MKKISKVLLFVLFWGRLAFAAEPIHLIWQGWPPPELSWEEDWIRELLSDIDAEIEWIVDRDYSVVLDRAIIVTSLPERDKYKAYYKSFVDRGYRFGIIHISDEEYTHPTDFYSGAKFVFRNYWHLNFKDKKIHFYPLGYKRLFWRGVDQKILKSAKDRRYVWSFVGQVTKSTRAAMIHNMRKIPNYYTYENPGFNAPTQISDNDYRNSLLESIFIPCPRGFVNLDTCRLAEALECGCIPIVEKFPSDYFAGYLGAYPFPAVSSWDEAPQIIRWYLNHPNELERKRAECQNWWISYKTNLKAKIAQVVEASFAQN